MSDASFADAFDEENEGGSFAAAFDEAVEATNSVDEDAEATQPAAEPAPETDTQAAAAALGMRKPSRTQSTRHACAPTPVSLRSYLASGTSSSATPDMRTR